MTRNQDKGALEQVREARMKISKQFDHDPKKLVEYYIELQKNYEDRLVSVNDEKEKSVQNTNQ